MTTRFLTAFVLAVCLGGCAKPIVHTITCKVCGQTWTTEVKGMATMEIRNHLEECRRLQRFRATYELIKVSPKLDSLP
jgi:hypothetical protein